MSCLGVHFAIEANHVEQLRSLQTDQEKLNFVLEHVEEELYDTDHAAASDKSWDAMHRTLSDGYLTWDGGEYPLNHTVLGGEQLYSGNDFIMSLKSPAQVAEIASVLTTIDNNDFHSRYFAIPARDYDAVLDDDDLEYTWSWFQDVRALYQRAAEDGRYVLFTADQ